MRLALVSQEYPPETAKGGIGSQTCVKAHGLARLGHQVHVLSRSTTGQHSHALDGPVRVSRIPGFENRLSLHTEAADWLTYSADVAAALAALHADTPFDLVEFPEWAAEGFVHLLNRTEWNHLPTVIQLHGPLVMFAHTLGWPTLDSEFYRVGSFMEGTCLRLADAVCSSSGCSALWVAQHYGLDRHRIPILHAGIDTALFSPRDVPKESRPTILFVGKIAPNKGARLLLEACCHLAPDLPDLQLRIIGRGDEKWIQELRTLAQALGRPGLLDLAGFVPREQLPAQLSRAHIFAMPSLYEGGPGFAYLEAMACGLPVIACRGSGAAESLQDHAALVPPNDLPALIAALRSLLTDQARRRQLAENGRQFVLREADSQLCLGKIESFYTAVVTGQDWRAPATHLA